MKRCTFIQSGEKVYILCVLYMSVEIWLIVPLSKKFVQCPKHMKNQSRVDQSVSSYEAAATTHPDVHEGARARSMLPAALITGWI